MARDKHPNDLPYELARMTPDQVEAILDFYVGLGLPALRGRQARGRAQQAAAFAKPESAARDLRLRNLAVDEALLSEAVWRTAWPAERHVIEVESWLDGAQPDLAPADRG